MKKFALLAALAAILVGVLGCAAEENTTDNNTTEPATTTPAE
jgi:hypothetical protein